MSKMMPKERIARLFKKEPVDEMPVFSGQGMVTIQAIEKMGIRFAEVHSSAQYLAHSAITSAEIFGFDAMIIPYDLCTVPESLGRGVSLYVDSDEILYPTVPEKWNRIEDVRIPEDFLNHGRMPIVDEAFRILKSESEKKQFAIGGHVLGPLTMAGQVFELDLLLKGLKKDKERFAAFLTRMTDLVIKVARHYQELGVDYMNIREMGSGTDIISPKMWKSLVQPNLIRVFDSLESPAVLHICGSTDLIVEMMNECGADAISVDHKNTVSETRRKLGNNVLLFGDFDPFATLVKMDVKEVAPVIRKCIDDGVDAVWPGCDIWPDVKRENVEAYVKAVRDYGKRPSPAVGRL
ncbi:MAG: methyltransferase [Deltaproteobacteria bacterium HGW-Deltaproteobacteria-15]|jgi:[methyl-Co(III) methanol-specific corrinoid protein]:coenzyme M methyltransferase|nr:MAG: methyltransferase [Deltaproteobacteria bacterium HGW-Deltaproteobacteria-15]